MPRLNIVEYSPLLRLRNKPERRKRRIFLLLAGLALVPLSHNVVNAQTPAASPSEQEQRLLEEKRLLEIQRDIELAKKAIRDAQPETPEPTATPLAGNTTLDEGVKFETAMVAYKAMSQIANQIGIEISTSVSGANSFAIYDPQVVERWRMHQALFPAFKGQTEDIRNQYIAALCQDPNSGASPFFRTTYCTDRAGTNFSSSANPASRSSMKVDAVTGAIGAGATLIKSFIDIAALFRTETKIEGKAVTIDNSAFVAEIFRSLKNHYSPRTISLYYPGVFHPRIDDSETIFRIGQLFIFQTEAERIIRSKTSAKPDLVSQLNSLLAEKLKAEEKVGQIGALKQVVTNLNEALRRERVPAFRSKLWDEKKEALAKLGTLGDEANLITHIGVLNLAIVAKKAAINAIDAPVKTLADLNARFQVFVDQYVKPDATGTNMLALFIKSEDIDRIMGNGNSYWLELKSVSAGGNNRTRKNLIWFFAGARLDHSGGVVAEYTLYNEQGAVVRSDKVAYYEGYVEPKRIKKGKLEDAVK